MTFLDVVKLAGAIMASIGGAGAIIFGLSGFLGKIWADRALQADRHRYDQLNLQLQNQLADGSCRLQAELDNASRRLQIELDALGLIHSLRTKEEFARLAELWKRFADLSSAYNSLHHPFIDFPSPDAKAELKFRVGLRDAFQAALADTRDYFHQEMIFIPEPIARLAESTLLFAARVPYLDLCSELAEGLKSDPEIGAKLKNAKFKEAMQETFQGFVGRCNHLEELIRKHMRGESLGETERPY